MKTFWGVDPGAQGCVAIYTPGKPFNELVTPKLHMVDLHVALDETTKTYRKFTQLQLSMESIAQSLQVMTDIYGHPEFAIVETPASMPGEGVVSSFTFGKNCGLIEGILYGMGIKIFQTVPAVWKSQMGLSNVKAKSIKKAIELFGNADIDGGIQKFETPKRIIDGRAEAAILAWMGAHKMGGKL